MRALKPEVVDAVFAAIDPSIRSAVTDHALRTGSASWESWSGSRPDRHGSKSKRSWSIGYWTPRCGPDAASGSQWVCSTSSVPGEERRSGHLQPGSTV